MTEKEWDKTNDCFKLLEWLAERGDFERKALLFIVAVERKKPQKQRTASDTRLVDSLELYADRNIDRDQLDQIYLDEGDYVGAPFDCFNIRHAQYAVGDTRAERRTAARLIRDIFGNPFRPVAFDLAWRSEAAVGLARAAYEGRNLTLLPVLADALEEAGCDHDEVLAHCRQPDATHVRGCWVVDLVLGKS